MPNLNKVQLMGNITRDPEVRYTPKGTAVTDISLAINRNFNGDDGERREILDAVVVFHRVLEVFEKRLDRGFVSEPSQRLRGLPADRARAVRLLPARGRGDAGRP
jgi:hypothetical protein